MRNDSGSDQLIKTDYIKVYNENTGIEDKDVSSGFYMFPNPAKDFLTLNIHAQKSENYILKLRSITGYQVKKITLSEQFEIVVDISELSAGVYFLELASDDHVYTQKLVIK